MTVETGQVWTWCAAWHGWRSGKVQGRFRREGCFSNGCGFEVTLTVVPTQGHLDSIRKVMRGDFYIQHGSRQRKLGTQQVLQQREGLRSRTRVSHQFILIEEFRRTFPDVCDRNDLNSKPPSSTILNFMARLREEPETESDLNPDEGRAVAGLPQEVAAQVTEVPDEQLLDSDGIIVSASHRTMWNGGVTRPAGTGESEGTAVQRSRQTRPETCSHRRTGESWIAAWDAWVEIARMCPQTSDIWTSLASSSPGPGNWHGRIRHRESMLDQECGCSGFRPCSSRSDVGVSLNKRTSWSIWNNRKTKVLPGEETTHPCTSGKSRYSLHDQAGRGQVSILSESEAHKKFPKPGVLGCEHARTSPTVRSARGYCSTGLMVYPWIAAFESETRRGHQSHRV